MDTRPRVLFFGRQYQNGILVREFYSIEFGDVWITHSLWMN